MLGQGPVFIVEFFVDPKNGTLNVMKDLAKEGITMMAVANAMNLSIGRLPCADGKKRHFCME